jgi:hypothetical protein
MENIRRTNLMALFDSVSDDSDSDQEYQLDQPAAVDAEEEISPVLCDCTKAIAKPLFTAPTELGECPICYDELTMVNFTVTRCGHAMHASCAFSALEFRTDCPMCRTTLVLEKVEEEDDEDEDEDEDDNNSDDEEEDDDEVETNPITLEQLTLKLVNMGYTLADVIRIYVGNQMPSQNESRYTDEFIEKLDDDMDGIINGTISLAHVDKRSYADVVNQSAPIV